LRKVVKGLGPDIKKAEKLRRDADKMQVKIDERLDPKRAPWVNMTVRQANQAASISAQGREMQAQQKILRALADDAEHGTTPEFMLGVKTRKMIEDLLRQPTDEKAWDAGVYQRNINECLHVVKGQAALRKILGKYAQPDGVARITDIKELDACNKLAMMVKGTEAEWAGKTIKAGVRKWRAYYHAGLTDLETLYKAKEWCEGVVKLTAAELRQHKIEEEDRALIGVKIEGFWPTPKDLAEQMVAEAGIEPGMKVLEPSAGKGDIAMAIRETGADLEVIEIIPRLIRILEGRGFNVVGSDIFHHSGGPYDRILMNPPFEKMIDIDHVQYAYNLLKPGGKMIAIMGEGPFFRSDRKAAKFRKWLTDVRGYGEKLPQGTFNASSRIVRFKKR